MSDPSIDALPLHSMQVTHVDVLTRLGVLCLLVATAVANVSVLAGRSQTATRTDEEAGAYMHSNFWSAVVCIVAAGFYIELNTQRTGLPSVTVRNLDWLITCPLLALEMGSLLGGAVSDGSVVIAALASGAMILIGWGDAIDTARLVLGFAALAIVALALLGTARRAKASRSRRRIVALFFAVWLLYGLVAVARSANLCGAAGASASYNLLDGVSKAAFGLTIAYLGMDLTRRPLGAKSDEVT